MMSDFDYSLDVDDSYEEPEDKNNLKKSRPAPGPMFSRRYNNSQFMNTQYSEAFGDYRGGYGPGCGFGPRPRPYPGPMRGRGFGPICPPPPRLRGPPQHMAAQFLEDCDVHPQYIRNLPWDLLDMIEPGYCGLCSQNLESFDVAKIHYNCKNHNKAQKKFLAQHKTVQIIKETPIKARNLYCELCDVHITSNVHAESHYAGKSHRAIVDGRKGPKNPILLKPGMEQRLGQLIRREKKNLKALPEAEKVDVKAALDKSIPPELVCEICKTTVTCSEQMTNHLNGKRHLNKEKQHILKMMKGEADADDDTADAAEADDADNAENVDDKKETEVSEAVADYQDDWTSGGGGDWDNQHTTE